MEQPGTAWHSVAQRGTEWHRMAQNGTERHRMAQNSTEWHRVAQNFSMKKIIGDQRFLKEKIFLKNTRKLSQRKANFFQLSHHRQHLLPSEYYLANPLSSRQSRGAFLW